jgi:alkaline phosphatase D
VTQAPVSRRAFLGGVAATGALVACSGGSNGAGGGSPTPTAPPLPGDPFTLGVASGDPTSEAVVLWTRLAPDPLVTGGGMPEVDIPVRWEVATSDGFGDVVVDGTATAALSDGHSVHVDAQGLEPGREYWYRFMVDDHASPVGRAVTMPAAGEAPDGFVMGHVSCARWGEGYFAAYRDLAEADCDLVVCCGDYIYERDPDATDRVRDGQITAITIDDYRYLYALHRTDDDLRAAHAAAPWLAVWDDHEASNNYIGRTPDLGSESRTPQAFLERRAAAYKAWWEHMPVRFDPPTGPDLAIHHHVDVGALARIHLIDTRQYRTPLDCPDSVSSIGRRCDTSFAEGTSVLGSEQEAWLAESLSGGEDRVWDVVANQIVLHQWRFGPGDDTIWNLDQWDGYPTARARVLDDLAGSVGDVVVLTGDVHSSWVSDLKADFDRPSSERIGTEFVAPGVTSSGEELEPVALVVQRNSPHVKYAEARHRGWLRHELGPDRWTTEFRHADDHRRPDTQVRVASTWELAPGREVAGTG